MNFSSQDGHEVQQGQQPQQGYYYYPRPSLYMGSMYPFPFQQQREGIPSENPMNFGGMGMAPMELSLAGAHSMDKWSPQHQQQLGLAMPGGSMMHCMDMSNGTMRMGGSPVGPRQSMGLLYPHPFSQPAVVTMQTSRSNSNSSEGGLSRETSQNADLPRLHDAIRSSNSDAARLPPPLTFTRVQTSRPESNREPSVKVEPAVGGSSSSASAAATKAVSRQHFPSYSFFNEGVTLRKSCDFCVGAKRRCDGMAPCARCQRRSKKCTYSVKKKCGPKGPHKYKKAVMIEEDGTTSRREIDVDMDGEEYHETSEGTGADDDSAISDSRRDSGSSITSSVSNGPALSETRSPKPSLSSIPKPRVPVSSQPAVVKWHQMQNYERMQQQQYHQHLEHQQQNSQFQQYQEQEMLRHQYQQAQAQAQLQQQQESRYQDQRMQMHHQMQQQFQQHMVMDQMHRQQYTQQQQQAISCVPPYVLAGPSSSSSTSYQAPGLPPHVVAQNSSPRHAERSAFLAPPLASMMHRRSMEDDSEDAPRAKRSSSGSSPSNRSVVSAAPPVAPSTSVKAEALEEHNAVVALMGLWTTDQQGGGVSALAQPSFLLQPSARIPTAVAVGDAPSLPITKSLSNTSLSPPLTCGSGRGSTSPPVPTSAGM